LFETRHHDDDVSDDPVDGSTGRYEPDEPDPETEHTPDVPSVSIPETGDTDAPPELMRAFWGTVVAVNIGLFAVSLGLMVGVFRGQWRLGAGAIALGVVALLAGYRRYRTYQNR
jgi:hypothetical protein